jgi:hypothetical protein
MKKGSGSPEGELTFFTKSATEGLGEGRIFRKRKRDI